MSTAVQVLGGAMLAHSIYSLREFYQATASKSNTVPQDMILEAAIGALLIVVTVFRNMKLGPAKLSDALAAEETAGKSRFLHLETRARFQDIRAKRSQHLEWKQSQ